MTDTSNTASMIFTSGAHYIAWRQQMRQDYARLSTSIRALKREVGDGMRAGDPVGTQQNKLATQRPQAAAMMEMRTEAKQLARAAHAARIATEIATAA